MKTFHKSAGPRRQLNTGLTIKHCPFCGSPPVACEYSISEADGQTLRAEIYCGACEVGPSVARDGADSYGADPVKDDAARLAVVLAWNRRVI